MSYILAVHVPIAGMALLPVLLGWPTVLFPLHIAFLELVIDPACSMVFENEPAESGVMRRPPRDVNTSLFGGMTLVLALLQGLGVLVVLVLLQAWCEARGLGIAVARGALMPALLLGAFALVLDVRREGLGPVRALWIPNPLLRWMGIGLVVLLALMMSVPVIRGLLGLVAPRGAGLLAALVAVAAILLWLEFWAVLERRRTARP
jgi:Ca2+-transporting ATPase